MPDLVETAMIVTTDAELQSLRAIGRIVATVLRDMIRATEAGMTTLELDEIGRRLLTQAGAVSAPESTYKFPGATCISVNEEAAHGIPGPRILRPGELVNIDVSASKDGFFSDTGASFVIPEARPLLTQLCQDGRKAMEIGVAEVRPGAPLAGIGQAVGRFAKARGYTLITNLASHGIGRALHEEPGEIPTWPDKSERRVIRRGMVLTVEPFLSRGAHEAVQGEDGWTLYAEPAAPCVQYEHTVVATDRGPLVLTRAG